MLDVSARTLSCSSRSFPPPQLAEDLRKTDRSIDTLSNRPCSKKKRQHPRFAPDTLAVGVDRSAERRRSAIGLAFSRPVSRNFRPSSPRRATPAPRDHSRHEISTITDELPAAKYHLFLRRALSGDNRGRSAVGLARFSAGERGAWASSENADEDQATIVNDRRQRCHVVRSTSRHPNWPVASWAGLTMAGR